MDRLRIALVIVCCAVAPVKAEPRQVFEGDRALFRAGSEITSSLGYRHDFDPGVLALRWIPAYAGRFTIPVLFSPRLGHQVILQKDHTVTDASGSQCASFAVTIEHFPDLPLVERDQLAQQGRLPVTRLDLAGFHACLAGDRSIALTRTELTRDQAAEPGRLAFSRPMAIGAGAGGGSGF
jgi:hypothetical protein